MRNLLPDTWLTLLYLLSGALSLVILTSISPERVAQQALMFGIGLVAFIYLSSQDAAVYKTFAPFAYLVAVILLGLTLLIGDTVRGSTRWIELGTFQLQTGELAKPLLVIAFAYLLTHFPLTKTRNYLFHFVAFFLPIWFIFAQPDLGTALAVSSIWLAQVFISGISYWLIAGVGGLAVLMTRYLPLFLEDYQLRRLETFIDPFRDPLGAGYNVIQSIIAVGSGGILGKGLGHGTQSHLRFLPERHTDFIFASLAEELGIIGSILVILCLGGLLYRLLVLATHAHDTSARLIYIGSFGYIFFQTLINIGMNIGIAPVTGVTLPLISYGGSSVVSLAITLGIVSSYARGDRTRSLIEIR